MLIWTVVVIALLWYFMTPAELTTAMQAFEQLGVTQIRVFLPWRAMEPSRGGYNWAVSDRILDAAAQRGIAVVGAVTSTPVWASRNGFWLPNAAPNDPADYARFMTQLALRYGATSVLSSVMGISARLTFVIRQSGVIAAVFDSAFRASEHVDGARDAIRALRDSGP